MFYEKLKYILLIIIGVISAIALREYLLLDATFFLGIIVLYFTLNIDEKTPSNRWVYGTIFCLISSFFIPSYTLFYLTIISSFMWLFERSFGRQNPLPFFVFITVSPLFKYLTNVFTFDIRLALTSIAARTLRVFDPSVLAAGNVIQTKNGDWQIDEACMGVSMLGLSFILTYFFVAHHARESKKRILLRGLFSILILAFLLNLLANWVRIVTLIFLKILPHTGGHEAIGLLSLAVYNLLPLYFLIKKGVEIDWFFKPIFKNENNFIKSKNNVQSIVFQCFIVILIVFKGIDLTIHKPQRSASIQAANKAGFETVMMADGVCRLKNDSVLIYLKNLNYFFATEHSPMICWKGSGYNFQKIEKAKQGDFEFYTGILEKKDEKIYAAWWFESDKIRTIEQTKWRWVALRNGQNFRLVNINASNPKALFKAVLNWTNSATPPQ